MNQIEREENIDLTKVWSLMWAKRRVCSGIVIGFTILALIISLIWPKEYTSQVTVQTSSSGVDIGGAAAAMAALTGGSLGGGNKAMTYIELMKTRVVLDPIIAQVFDDEPEEDRPEAEKFAKKYLTIANTKQTQLITLEAKGRTPEEAQYIAENVVNNFLQLMTSLNKENKSLVVSFLDERIDVAKKEADDSAQALENFSKEHKIYGPEEQVKAQLEKSAAYDKTLGELQVKRMASQASFRSASTQLGEQNSDAIRYSMTDNAGVQKVRNLIIDKEAELAKLRTVYTEKHPSVVQAKTELENLNGKLQSEVRSAVYSQGTAISDTQAELQLARYQAATSMAVAEASEAKVKDLQAKSDEEMSGMADDILEYNKLYREAQIKETVYENLSKQIEQAKIQQTMESMDIQIVDPANLPREDNPTWPKKKIITLVGMVVGIAVSFGYVLVLYRKIN